METFLTLAIVQPAETRHFLTLAIVYINRNFLTLAIVQPAKSSKIGFLQRKIQLLLSGESSSPFFLQEFRPLTPLKATYRFTSLTVIGMMKIMCNIWI
jgi:hypothetical protein